MIHKLRTRILVIMLMIGVISAFPITFISMTSLIRSSKEQAKDFGEKSAYYNSQIINTWLSEKAKTLTELKTRLKQQNSMEEVQRLLRMYSDINKDFISIFIGLDNNEMIDAYGWIPDENYRIIERPWYQKANDKENYITTSVYLDVNKNENVTAVASGIDLLGKKGVIAANIYVDYIVDIINDIKYGENGFAVLLDDSYNLITGPKDEKQLAVFNHIFETLEKGKGFGDSNANEFEVDGVEYIAAYSSIEGFDWSLFLVAPLSDFIHVAYAMRTQLIYILIGTLILIIMIDFYLSKSISLPIETLVNGVSRIAKGNFDSEINIQTQDEIGELSIELDKMRINLKKIFESIKYESKILSMNSQNLIQHLDETYQGTSRFLMMLSHDIKTPITLIKGYSKALSMEMVDPDKTKEYIERIQYRCEQIENIVTDTLDNTYEANNDVRVNLKEIKISDYINMILYNTENYVNNQKHQFIQKIDYGNIDLEGAIAVDITKIQRVVNNILSNAVKFSEDESVIELIIREESGRILTCFKDQGIGIKKEEQAKIFNMFYKSDDSKKGYGLGLYINKAIIEAHDGEIYFTSEYEQGTTSGYYLNIIK